MKKVFRIKRIAVATLRVQRKDFQFATLGVENQIRYVPQVLAVNWDKVAVTTISAHANRTSLKEIR